MTDRSTGFYEVKMGHRKTVAKYLGGGKWHVFGMDGQLLTDRAFQSIGPMVCPDMIDDGEKAIAATRAR